MTGHARGHPSRPAENDEHLRMTIQLASRRCCLAHALSGISLSRHTVRRKWVSIRSRVFSRRAPISAIACQSTPFSATLNRSGMLQDAMLMISNNLSKAIRRIRSSVSIASDIPWSSSSTVPIADRISANRSAKDGGSSDSRIGQQLILSHPLFMHLTGYGADLDCVSRHPEQTIKSNQHVER
jgi:hypothetical protein